MGKPYYKASMEELYCRDAIDILKELPSESVNCIITSPPYWAVRKYGNSNKELGQERFFQEYVRKIVKIFDEAKRILKKEGTCWINLGDIYAGNKIGKTDNKVNSYLKQETKGLRKRSQSSVKDKSLCNIPHRFAIAMIDRGWIHRNTIIWYKRNAMPASVKDRFTVDYEFIFFFVKSKNITSNSNLSHTFVH